MVGDGASTWGSLPSLNAKEDEEGGGVRGGERGRKRCEDEREPGLADEGEEGGGETDEERAPPPGMPCFTKCKQGITLFHDKSEKR